MRADPTTAPRSPGFDFVNESLPSQQFTDTQSRPRRLTVIIVNHESWPDALRLTVSLAAEPEFQSGQCEIVVVDNASTGPIPADFLAPYPGLRLLARPFNDGFAAGVNAGWRVSLSPWLLVLNPDVEVAAGFLGQVLRDSILTKPIPTVLRESSASACLTRTDVPRAPLGSIPPWPGPSGSSSYRARGGNTRPVGEFTQGGSTGSPGLACSSIRQ